MRSDHDPSRYTDVKATAGSCQTVREHPSQFESRLLSSRRNDLVTDATLCRGRPCGAGSAANSRKCTGCASRGDDNDRHIGWVRAADRAMRPWTMNGMPLNFMNDIDNARVQATFGAEKYRRLVALKDAYDPTNVFRMNQNVPPSR
jgi:hypothetical protein